MLDNNSVRQRTEPQPIAASTRRSSPQRSRQSDNSEATKTKILFVNRSYWPDMEATGQLLTELCEGLSDSGNFEVSVLCGAPNFPAEGAQFNSKGTEIINGVTVRRTWHTTFDKSSFVGRLCNFITFCVSAFFSLLFGPRPDMIVCQTDPPLSPIAACLVAFLRRTKFVCYLQDIYPDIAVQCGKVPEGFFIKMLRRFLVWCYCRAEKIIVVSNDMRTWLRDHNVDDAKVVVIENWVDTEALRPIKQNNDFRAKHLLDGKFVVMYSGNLGQTQRFDMLLDAAERLQDSEDIVFMVVGGGVRWGEVTGEAKRRGLNNIRFLPYQPKSYLAQSLSAADVQIVMLDQSMTSLMMPSKLYSALAAGCCILGLGNRDSHLAEIIVDNQCGWFFGESQLDELVEKIETAAVDRQMVEAIGQSSRDYAVEFCGRAVANRTFQQTFLAISGTGQQIPHPVPSESEQSDEAIKSTVRRDREHQAVPPSIRTAGGLKQAKDLTESSSF